VTQSMGVEANNMSPAVSRGGSVQQRHASLAEALLKGSSKDAGDAGLEGKPKGGMWGAVANASKLPKPSDTVRPSQTKLHSFDDNSDSSSNSDDNDNDEGNSTHVAVQIAIEKVSPARAIPKSFSTSPKKDEDTASDSDDTGDDDPLECFFQRATAVFNDCIDALEATVWDICSSSAR
jgi:hypothetical protein